MRPGEDPLTAAIARVRAKFLTSLNDRCAEVAPLLSCADTPPDDILVPALTALHKTAGSAGSLGYRDLSEAAFGGEHSVKADLDSTRSISPYTREWLVCFLQLAERAMEDNSKDAPSAARQA